MSDYVYLSNIRSNFSVYAKVHSGLDYDEHDQASRNKDPIIDVRAEIARRYVRGVKLEASEIPARFFVRKHFSFNESLKAFYANGFIVLGESCAEIFRKHDLGENELVETQIFKSDRKTKLLRKYYVLNFGCQKESSPQSDLFNSRFDMTKVFEKAFGGTSSSKEKPLQIPLKVRDDSISLSPNALVGPDFWHEARMRDAIFFSKRLFDALSDAKMTKPFEFYRCIVRGA